MFDGLLDDPIAHDALVKQLEIDKAWAQHVTRIRSRRSPTLTRDLARHLCGEQNWRCCNCGTRIALRENQQPGELLATFQHLRPRVEGGSDDITNIAMSCTDCNTGDNPIWRRYGPEIREWEAENFLLEVSPI